MESILIVKILQTVMVPLLAISGLGLFILVVQTRYMSLTTRMRALNSERLALIRNAIVKEMAEVEQNWDKNRLKTIEEQLSILKKRGKLLKDALQYIFIAVLTFIFSSVLIFVEHIAKIQASFLILVVFPFGLAMLFLTCINMVREVRSSYRTVMLDLGTRVPEEYRLKEMAE